MAEAPSRGKEVVLGKNFTEATVSQLPLELKGGRDPRVDALFVRLYSELQESAHRHRQRWRDDYTLDTIGLVHEVYLKLAGRKTVDTTSRAHFLALASRAMRHVLCNYARDRRTLKRGGRLEAVPLDEEATATAAEAADPDGGAAETLVALDRALNQLERIDPRRGRVVECRFFGGMTVTETSEAIGVSPRTVKRDWAVAQAWLRREMSGEV